MDDSMYDMEEVSDFTPPPKSKAKTTKPAVPKAAVKKSVASKPKLPAKPKSTVPKKRTKADTEDEEPNGETDHAFDDESLLNDTPPASKKSKIAPNPVKSSHKKPLTEVVNENMASDPTSPKVSKKKRVSEQYQKLTQLEHIIKRPDTYIGSTERTEKQMWIFNSATEAMEYREVSYVPGLFKIFDEILVNAADNKQNDKNMDEIKVTIDRESGEISVMNNGRGIPIEIHSKEQIYIPEMIFGHLLTGSNYDDNEQKITGGRNGYGAKLCNIFSTVFTLETIDSKQRKKYRQTWTDNMSKMGKAKITDSSKGDDYTKITFKADFAKFGMDSMDDDHEALFKRRVYDLSGTVKGVKVFLNGTRLAARNFKKYIEMYTKAIKQERGDEAANDNTEIILESPDPRWEIGFTVSDGSFQQVSFVNSIATTSGGTHVNYIADQITTKLAEIVKKKNKGGAALKLNQIKNHVFVFVNCLIVNPAFSSQTKEQLTTKPSQFGSKCILSDEFMKKIAKTEVIENILSFAQQKADQILKKSDGSRRSRVHNPKLTDANKAGTKDGYRCTLILTEGDSAKGMAMAGRAVVGPDLFGVFPLRGKLLNVRDASIDQISKNAEIQNIKNFLGLQHKKQYTDVNSLRYGQLMVMTDQDHDGSHIKGLLINFLQVQYPSLLKIPGFLVEFITPIIKVYKGDSKNPTKSKAFFTMPEYLAWKEAHKHERGWEHKYYKGLGTSSTEESQEYFNDIDKHHKGFEVMKDEETNLIDLAFSKKKADERKEWLRQFKPGTFLDHSMKSISYTDFINKELILFSMADNIRSIPSVIDGFKPGQRKVLFTCFKKNIKKDMKVVELTGMVMGLTAYQHGDTSLQQTIVGLAQTFVGSNNVNCLEPAGNFGTRLQGGSDAASARYIYTRLSPFARKLFHAADEPLLKYNTDDDHQIEPEMYVPVLPMLLVNGADGIGTGWSTSIPNYNPIEIVENLRRRMEGEEFKPMQPWFRGFKGVGAEVAQDRFKFSGIIKQTSDNEIEITELPIRVWTQDFKEKLEEILKAEKTPSFIKDYKDYNTHKDVHFIIQMEEKYMKQALEEGLEEKFKLSKSIATSNLVAFDAEGRITKYPSVEAILEEFYNYRLRFYQLRKDWLLNELDQELKRFTNQARFIQMIIDGKLNISKKKKKILIEELKKLGFDGFSKKQDAQKAGETAATIEDEEADEEDDVVPDASSYDYLLGMPLWSLTQERVEKLQRQIGDKEAEIDNLLQKTKEDLWKADLDEFVSEWHTQLNDEHDRERQIRKGRRVSKKFATSKSTAKKRKGLGDASDDDDDFEVKKAVRKTGPAARPKPAPVQAKKTPYVPLPIPDTKPFSAALERRSQYTDGASDEFDAPGVSDALPWNGKVEAKPLPNSKKINQYFDVKAEDEGLKPVVKPTTRTAASKKPKYALSSDEDSDNGDDLLANLGDMVKGLPSRIVPDSNQVEPPASSAISGKTNGDGSGKPSQVSSKPALLDDDTDMLMMSDQAQPTVARKISEVFELSDEESEPIKPVKNAKAVVKKSTAVAATKPKPQPKATKITAKKPAKSKVEQSPIAKAYAKRLAKKIVDSDDEIDAVAEEILDSPSGSGSDVPIRKPAARPARRAATTKTKATYVPYDSDEEDGVDAFDDASSAQFSDD